MTRILAALKDTPPTGKHIIPDELLMDISWFLTYAQTMNGLVLLCPPLLKTWMIECDSTLKGGGAYSPTQYFTEEYHQDLLSQDLNINQLEALNLVITLNTLAPPDPHNFAITINKDNQTSQAVLSMGTGRDKILCACAHEIWRFAANYSCAVQILHKLGKELILANAPSRQHTDSAPEQQSCVCKKGLHETHVLHSLDGFGSSL